MTNVEAVEVLNNKGFMFCDTDRCGDCYGCEKCDEALIMAKEALLQEPIIHCKDCKYYQPLDKNKPYDCYSGMSGVIENDFCSFAEPKGGDTE